MEIAAEQSFVGATSEAQGSGLGHTSEIEVWPIHLPRRTRIWTRLLPWRLRYRRLYMCTLFRSLSERRM